MKVYDVTKKIINRIGRVISTESWVVSFDTDAEMNYYMRGIWAMAEENEIFVAVLIN